MILRHLKCREREANEEDSNTSTKRAIDAIGIIDLRNVIFDIAGLQTQVSLASDKIQFWTSS